MFMGDGTRPVTMMGVKGLFGGRTLLFAFLFLMTDALSIARNGRCRCVPDQWQGMIKSVEREFDLISGMTATTESSSKIYYDYTNNKMVEFSLDSGYRWIKDFDKVRILSSLRNFV